MSQSATSFTFCMGMAKPSPSTVLSWAITFKVVMPTTCPRSLMRAPPEFPKLIGALVWMTWSSTPSTGTVRLRAEIIPCVIEVR